MNSIIFSLIIIAVFSLVILIKQCGYEEGFWGGYFPVPYMKQPLIYYGRTGVNAATDLPPKLLVNRGACNVNP